MIAAGYTRLSEDGMSIPKQKQQIRTYCTNHSNLSLDRILNDGKWASGYNVEERPEYRELRQLVQDNQIDAVVVRDVDRIGRDFDERLRFILDCREHGIEIHSFETGKRDLSDPYDILRETAEAASSDKSKRAEINRSKQATKERIDNGYYHGKPPFGLRFDSDKRFLEKDPDEFEVIESVIEARESGRKVGVLADEYDLSPATVSRIANRGTGWYEDKLTEYGSGEE